VIDGIGIFAFEASGMAHGDSHLVQENMSVNQKFWLPENFGR
jgi:hypothetical protein